MANQRNTYLTQPDEKLLAACRVETYRASGPGGQHRNKRDSAVRLMHKPTGVVVTATERRSQHENRRRAIKRLRKSIALEVREKVRTPSDALRAALDAPAWPRISQKNAAYLVAAAEILDHLEADRGKVSETAKRLGVSTASVTKFLSLDFHLLAAANRIRRRFGHKFLR